MWNTDSAGNYRSQSSVIAGNSAAFAALEASFQQDINDDGSIAPSTAVEAAGSTILERAGNAYYLAAAGGSSGPLLSYNGAPVTAGQFGAWVPIGAEQAGSVYQVAWKNGAADQYLAWTVDSSGNFLSQGGVVSGASWYAESFESALHQDLNGDGTTGVTTASIEAIGSTTLTKVADSYFVNYGGPSPVQLFYGSTYAAAGQFGAWKPIAAEQVGGTYQVAWKNGTADQYLAWTVGGAGNFMAQTAWWLEAPGTCNRSKPPCTRISTVTARSVPLRRWSSRPARPA